MPRGAKAPAEPSHVPTGPIIQENDGKKRPARTNPDLLKSLSLPAESHGYRARESALHVLWEQIRWLDAHVKNAKPRPPAPR